jgi:hypothetical protein
MKDKTSLSAGEAVFELLTSSEEVMGRATKVFPVMTTEANLPYVAYRRAGLSHTPTKAGMPGAEKVKMEVNCYAATYAESVELAEAVRKALEGWRWNDTESLLTVRGMTLADASEAWADDAFVQMMTFDVNI